MGDYEQTVYIVDDDIAILDSLKLLLESNSLPVRVYQRAESFLQDFEPQCRGCLVLDFGLPGMDGLELQNELFAIGSLLPIIFITGKADVPMAVQALKSGAYEFLQKPCTAEALLRVIHDALEFNARQANEWRERQSIEKRLEKLSPRELEVLDYIVRGQPNKVIALELDLSQRTVEIYRSNMMQKMQVDSLAQLVQQMTRLPRPLDSPQV
ncbi:MAG: response regulator [Pseudohongiellaceae bacterium]